MVVEDGGKPLIGFLKKSDLFKNPGCRFEEPDCMVEPNKDCVKMSAVYEITCDSCMEPVNTDSDIDPRS